MILPKRLFFLILTIPCADCNGDYIHELTLLKSSKNAGFGQCGRGRGESSIKPDMA